MTNLDSIFKSRDITLPTKVCLVKAIVFPVVPLRGEGSCGGGGAPRDSAGSGATEEGLTENQ